MAALFTFNNACAKELYWVLFWVSLLTPHTIYIFPTSHHSTLHNIYNVQFLLSETQIFSKSCSELVDMRCGVRVVWDPGWWYGLGLAASGPCLATVVHCDTLASLLLPSLQFSLSLLVWHRRVLRDRQQRFGLLICQ